MSAVAVLGLGKLGGPMAALLGASGHEVVGVDQNRGIVDKLNAGEPHIAEPQFGELLQVARDAGNFVATDDVRFAVERSNIAFVVVPTPSLRDGSFTNEYVIAAVRSIGEAIAELDNEARLDDTATGEKPFYVVSIVSTVMPGSTDGPIRAALEDASGRECGIDIGLVYNPTLIALGQVISDLEHPDLVIVGCDDEVSGRSVERVLAKITDEVTPFVHLHTVDAEIAKLSINCQLVARVSFSNAIAELCEAVPGANGREVCRAVGMDHRIGPSYLMPGGPAAGPCLPRDSTAFVAAAEKAGIRTPIMAGVSLQNQRTAQVIADKVVNNRKVAILGMTYKAHTTVQEASLGHELVERLERIDDVAVMIWDPSDPASNTASDVMDVIEWAEVVIVATPWPEFAGIDYGYKRVIDVWGTLPPEDNIERFGVSQA